MIQREYYNIWDAARRVKCKPEDLIHLGANGKLAIYSLVSDLPLIRMDRIEGNTEETETFPDRTVTSGPVRLLDIDLARIEANSTWDCSIVDKVDRATGSYCTYRIRKKDSITPTTRTIYESDLVVLHDDLEQLLGETSAPPKPTKSKPQDNAYREGGKMTHFLTFLVLGLLPLVAWGEAYICAEDNVTGFFYRDGEWTQGTFKPDGKFVVRPASEFDQKSWVSIALGIPKAKWGVGIVGQPDATASCESDFDAGGNLDCRGNAEFRMSRKSLRFIVSHLPRYWNSSTGKEVPDTPTIAIGKCSPM
jgi:hypothetical protein